MEGNNSAVNLRKGKITQIVDSCHSHVKSEESRYIWQINDFETICSPKSTQFEPQQGSAGETSRQGKGDLLDIDFVQTSLFKRGKTVGPASYWRLYLKKHKDHPGYLGLHLFLENSDTEDGRVLMSFVFSFVNVYGQDLYPKGPAEEHIQFMSIGESCGDPTFIKIQDLFSPQGRYLIQPNTIKIHLRMTIIYNVQEIQISEVLPRNSIWRKPESTYGMSILSNLWSTKSHADVTIECEGTEIPVHKSIICTASKVFADMFSHEMTEAISNRVVITDLDELTLNELLCFMYTGEVSPTYLDSFENGQLLLNAAEKYQMMSLTNFCWAYLCGKFLSDDYIAKLIFLAYHFSSNPEVKTEIYSYAARFWGGLKSREDIKQMIAQYPSAFIPILMLKGDGRY